MMKTRARQSGFASAAAALCLLVCVGVATVASAADIGLASLSDKDLVLLARRLVRDGRHTEACRVLDSFSSRHGRDVALDWEADVLTEACRERIFPEGWSAAEAPGRRPAPLGRIKAAQIFVFDSPALEDLEEKLRRLKERGFDTVIVRAFHNRGDRPLLQGVTVEDPGVYFRTAEAPVAANLLPEITGTAHRVGLRVFGWMTSRRSDWLIERHPEWVELQYDALLGRSVASRSLSIFEPGVRQSLGIVFRDLAAAGVDGILFQDDLVMRYAEGFSTSAVQAYLNDTGRGVYPDDLFALPAQGPVPRPRPPFLGWAAWKNGALLSFMANLVAAARQANPRVAFAANVYYESLLEPEKGLSWYAQDVGALASRVDYLAFMSYHRQMSEELSLEGERVGDVLFEAIRQSRRLAIGDERIIFKVQTTDWRDGSGIPEEEWAGVREFFRGAGGFGTVVLQNGRRPP